MGIYTRSLTALSIACVASVSVGFRSKEWPRNGIFSFGLRDRTEKKKKQKTKKALATQATLSRKSLSYRFNNLHLKTGFAVQTYYIKYIKNISVVNKFYPTV